MALAPAAPADVRAQILGTATHLFAAKGFDGTSIQEIAEAVGVRKPSLLYHFPSKDALRQAVIEQLLSRWNEVMPRVLLAATSSKGQFEGVVREFAGFFAADPDRARLLLREVLDRPREMRVLVERWVKRWVTAIAGFIEKGKQRGHLHADVDPEAYVIQMVNLIVTSVASRAALGTLPAARNLREIERVARASLFVSQPGREAPPNGGE